VEPYEFPENSGGVMIHLRDTIQGEHMYHMFSRICAAIKCSECGQRDNSACRLYLRMRIQEAS